MHPSRIYVPIDFVKGEVIGYDVDHVLKKSGLEFGQLVNEDTGELLPPRDELGRIKKPYRIAKYRNLVLKQYPHINRLFCKGSIHAFSRGGRYNYDDFTRNQFEETVKQLSSKLKVNLSQIKIQKMEWGVNIEPTCGTNQIVKNLLMYNWKPFEAKYDSDKKGRYRSVENDEFDVKVYNKALHQGVRGQILRIERRQNRYDKYCKKHGIGRSLQDLIDSNYVGMLDSLVSNWEDILFFDPFITNHNEVAWKYGDRRYWEELKNKSATTRMNHKRKLRRYNMELGDNIQGKTLELLLEKVHQLAQVDNSHL